MATRILRPLAVGAVDHWTLGAGATKMAAVDTGDPVAHDDNTTYIYKIETLLYQHFTLTPVPGDIAFVNSVSLGSRAKIVTPTAGQQMTDVLRLGATDLAVNSHPMADGNYSTLGPTSSTRPGGGAWTPADIATLQMGIQSSAGAPAEFRCTSLWIVLDYIPVRGFVFDLVWGVALLGCLTQPQLNAYLDTLAPGQTFTQQERVQAWRDYRNWRPRSSLQGIERRMAHT